LHVSSILCYTIDTVEGAPRAQVGEDRAGYRRGFGGSDKKGEAGAGADTQFQFVSDIYLI